MQRWIDAASPQPRLRRGGIWVRRIRGVTRFHGFVSLATSHHTRQNKDCTMEYVPGDLSPRERYKVLTSFVLPRPIAWVTTLGPTGVVNAAPFSFFNVFAEGPPLVMFAVSKRPDGRIKDTWVNI